MAARAIDFAQTAEGRAKNAADQGAIIEQAKTVKDRAGELVSRVAKLQSTVGAQAAQAVAVQQSVEEFADVLRTMEALIAAPADDGGSQKALGEPARRLKALTLDLQNEVSKYQGRVATSNASAQSGDDDFEVSGGLVIPLYLVILSLIGGAISLTRRIPEYQKQSDDSYVPVEGAPRLTPAMLREYLVFQIVQFVSAPLIATVAYCVIGPSSTAATVGLAFATGFASETVLLWVRAAVNKLDPVRPLGLHAGSVVGLVADDQDKPVHPATAVVTGAAALTAETKEGGRSC